MKRLQLPTNNLRFALAGCLLWLLVFFAERLTLLLLNGANLADCTSLQIVRMFVIGLRFDLVICCYLFIVPTVLLTVETFAGRKIPALRMATFIVSMVCMVPILLIAAADVPYFQHFGNRFNATAFDGLGGNFGTVVSMIATEPAYVLMLLPAVAVGAGLWWAVRKVLRSLPTPQKGHLVVQSLYTLLLLVLLFFGMRGNANFNTRPIQPGLAFFCNNQTLNQLGLNPCYVLIRSLSRQDQVDITFCDDSTAICEVQRQFGISHPDADFPILRKIEPSGKAHRYNVVLVIMESMSANNLQRNGYSKPIAPFLDSLVEQSLYYENCYTTGDRTCLGTYSSLVSYPTIMGRHPMYNTPIRTFNSMAYELKCCGYSTTFFVGHNKNFDNTNAFMMANGYDRLYSEEDYPAKERKNSYGVPDDYLFRYATKKLDSLSGTGKPFFATILTVSNHPPYYIPDQYKSPDKAEWEQAVTFADDAMRQFVAQAAKRPWFDSTVFVFVADHGNSLDHTYPLALSYFHSPLMFYSPAILQPEICDGMASQTDIFPTVMGILNLPYYNNTFGIDLRRHNRRYACMMNGTGYGIIGKEWYLVKLADADRPYLYHYRTGTTADSLSFHPQVAGSMQNYCFVQWQAAQYLLRTGKTFFRH